MCIIRHKNLITLTDTIAYISTNSKKEENNYQRSTEGTVEGPCIDKHGGCDQGVADYVLEVSFEMRGLLSPSLFDVAHHFYEDLGSL